MNESEKKDSKRDKKVSAEKEKIPEKKRLRDIDFGKGVVIVDNIRKEINDCEKKLERTRQEKYDYLTGEYFRKILAEECKKAGLPEDTFDRKRPEDPTKISPIPLKPSPMPVPRTSSAVVGWRSSLREHDLEFVGPLYVSARHTIEPPLTPGEFRITHQKFMYLG